MNKVRTPKKNLVIASTNLGKIKEFSDLLALVRVALYPQPKGLEIEETGQTFSENARIKALAVSEVTNQWTLADDSGLSVKALAGAPGIHSARYASNDKERIDRLLKELEGKTNREAVFTAALCVAFDGQIMLEVEGHCEGVIVDHPRGDGGFGYDPIFEVGSTGLTYAEMSKADKHKIGHRGRAFALLEPSLKKLLEDSH